MSSCENLEFDKNNQDKHTGLTTSKMFERFLANNQALYYGLSDIESFDIEDICEAPWEYNADDSPFANPKQYFKDWLHEFNISFLDIIGDDSEDEAKY